MAEALPTRTPRSSCKQLQVRSTGPTSTAQFHGHGGGDEDDKAALERYFRAGDRELNDILLNLVEGGGGAVVDEAMQRTQLSGHPLDSRHRRRTRLADTSGNSVARRHVAVRSGHSPPAGAPPVVR